MSSLILFMIRRILKHIKILVKAQIDFVTLILIFSLDTTLINYYTFYTNHINYGVM